MRKLGTALHVSRSGNIIVKVEQREPPPLGSRVFDRDMRRLGVVVDIIGPVTSPYVVVKPESSEVRLLFEPGPVYYAPPRRQLRRRGRPRKRKTRRR